MYLLRARAGTAFQTGGGEKRSGSSFSTFVKDTWDFKKRVREMSSQLFVTLSIYPSAHEQLRRHLPNPFRE